MQTRSIVIMAWLAFSSVSGIGAAQGVQPDTEREGVVSVIAFGSCIKADRPQPIWDVILEADPDLFLFIGDNMYADVPTAPQSADDIAEAYGQLAAIPEWQRFNENCTVLATWDDHDYGKNDAGEEWFLKEDSQRLFLDFFGVPSDSPRRACKGVYHAEIFGPIGKRVQVILLDTRYNRSPIQETPNWRDAGKIGPYGPEAGADGTMLGKEQWAWLEEQLREPAEVRIIASSIQVVASEHEWEGWYTMPKERQRLYDLIDATDASGVVMISGDRHLIELSCDRSEGTAYPMWDFTSSGMNQGPGDVDEPNQFRVGPVVRDENFGLISIDWDAADPVIRLEGRDRDGGVILSQLVFLSTLQED